MNMPITGRIYHVVDKTTGEIVKVGSTTLPLKKRFDSLYRKKYQNHFLKEAKIIESSELDQYEKGNPYCPFLWHLVASEHMEIIRQGTFDPYKLFSNKISPLMQKYSGFDGVIQGKIGGKIGGSITGKRWAENGFLASLRTPEHQRAAGIIAGKLSVTNKTGINAEGFDRVSAGRKGGLKNVETGHLQRISSAGGKVSGATQGRKNAESGRMREVQLMGLGKGGKIGGPKGMHTRWHVRRGLVSATCKHCIQA